MFLLILIISLMFATHQSTAAQNSAPASQVETKYDPAKDITTVSLAPLEISAEKGEYYSLHVATSFEYPGQAFKSPEYIKFEIRSVVKGKKLNPDLYITFLVDGEIIFVSSNRWAIQDPLPGRKAIGEVIEMKMSPAILTRLISARQAAIRMGGTRFDLSDSHKEKLRLLADKAKQ